jgi:hypothetical protein
MLAIVIENNVGSASTFGRAHGNRLRTGEGAQMINWPEEFCGLAVMIGRPPPAATVTVGDLTWGWRCVEVKPEPGSGRKIPD